MLSVKTLTTATLTTAILTTAIGNVLENLQDNGNDEKTVDWWDDPGRNDPTAVLFEASGAGT